MERAAGPVKTVRGEWRSEVRASILAAIDFDGCYGIVRIRQSALVTFPRRRRRNGGIACADRSRATAAMPCLLAAGGKTGSAVLVLLV